jgi:4-amino-4-deoxy-L-arabinose transferase-like glycosyltransferase
LLYGTGFSNQLIRRPLYAGMLALFHKLGGSNYNSTILLQILILAFIPSLTYLLTSKLSNRLAGLIAGGLILFREKNAIELSDKIVTANVKLMMSDMLAMLGMIAFVYVTVKILSRKDSNIWLLGIAGACLGLTALVRAQVLILLPLLLLFILIDRKSLKLGIKDSTLVMLGFILVMFPWVWRNWNLTGTLVLDDRGEERLLARNYSASPGNLPAPLPNETGQEFSARLKREVFTYVIEHPSDVAFFVSNHFFRNMGTSAVYMAPLLSTDPIRHIIDPSRFWESWQGELNTNSYIPLFITLIFVSLGINISQTKNKLAGWFPFAVFLLYGFGNALVRSSGWRFSLPADWTILVYYSIALSYLPSKIKLDETHAPQSDLAPASVANKPFPGMIIFLILLLAGASVPIAERLIPTRDFSDFTNNAEESLVDGNIISSSEFETFLEQEDAVFYSGVALYPRYIVPGSRAHLANTPPKEIRYLHFWLIDEGDHQIVFPTENPPNTFPHTSPVSIMGCKQEDYILAWAIVLHSSPKQILIQDIPILDCSTGQTK